MSTHTITIKHEIDIDFLSDVMITAFDGSVGGANYWCKVEEIEQSNPGQLDSIWSLARIIPEDYSEKEEVRTISHQTLIDGIQKILDTNLPSWHIYGYVYRAVAEGDAGHIDSDAADLIVQYGTFGEGVYG